MIIAFIQGLFQCALFVAGIAYLIVEEFFFGILFMVASIILSKKMH